MNERDVELLVAGEHPEPHRLLGAHPVKGGVVVRAYRPDAETVTLIREQGAPVELELVHPDGLFEAKLTRTKLPLAYELRAAYPDGAAFTFRDPYAFLPTLGELDLHLIGEGRHERLWDALGARELTVDGVAGVAFAVWAPSALAVSVVGDFNLWDGRVHPLRTLGSSGVWELFVPGVAAGALYKFEVRGRDRAVQPKADPLARAAELPPRTASVVESARHEWRDGEWLARRAAARPWDEAMSVYEVHLGSWRPGLSYRELADQLVAYVTDLGFTHVELMPVMEHPYAPSWGYQVSGYYAPTSRFGSPDDFRVLVDRLHQAGIGVLLDWVPAHFPKDAFALARFDGTALYEHADPRRGEHPDWGTLIFNYGRAEVRNFLVANAVYWLEQQHADGLRVDAVASMLYLDYSREEGEWVPNAQGGREDLDAIAFLRELNEVTHRRVPGIVMAAEESTSFSGVSRPTDAGGLGFGFKWNMGWMHDTLDYFSREPVHRRHHHHELTFGLVYAFSENFVLPLSHDEVVHGKRSLVGKMPGDRWQQLANLRALYGHMWAHPGKKLLFMGGEFAQNEEWNAERGLDWHLLEWGEHRGVQQLVRDLNRVYRSEPALFERDFDPSGFQWLEMDDGDANVLAYLRRSADGSRVLACACNLSPVVREGYRLGLPVGGRWREALNTDATAYGGSGSGNKGFVDAVLPEWRGQPCSAAVTLPPLAVVWLVPEAQAPEAQAPVPAVAPAAAPVA